ncbi:unnamed protein product [Brassica oleracea]|uniref:(rape) hypothetical protein n=1 Tax=Brassica napus TaxID=3708 RepID=A0A816LRA3_BRANA|nr:unnamed protein product [Brassica napus]
MSNLKCFHCAGMVAGIQNNRCLYKPRSEQVESI